MIYIYLHQMTFRPLQDTEVIDLSLLHNNFSEHIQVSSFSNVVKSYKGWFRSQNAVIWKEKISLLR